jgi:hypothetical protein
MKNIQMELHGTVKKLFFFFLITENAKDLKVIESLNV